jgi:hypothetical protein
MYPLARLSNDDAWIAIIPVIPLARKLKDCGVFGVSSEECLNYALQNRAEWADRGEEMVKEMVKEFGNDGKM